MLEKKLKPNPEHLAKLMEGVEAWNAWREANPDVIPELQGANLQGAFLGPAYPDGSFFNFAHLENTTVFVQDLKPVNLTAAHLNGANLEGARLIKAMLQGADLSEAHIEGAILGEADLQHASLRAAHLERAYFWKARLQAVNLTEAHLEGAILGKAKLEGAYIQYAHLEGANLWHAHFEGANLSHANLEGAEVEGVTYNRRTRCRGIRVATCYGSPRFKRFAQDQDFIEELKESGRWGRLKYWLWLLTSDCGQSFLRWAALSIFLAVGFAALFWWLVPGDFYIDNDGGRQLPNDFFTLLYYSVVTFTTLGFGDVTPKTTPAAALVMAEVILGYIMLGGLISIFATKLARRS